MSGRGSLHVLVQAAVALPQSRLRTKKECLVAAIVPKRDDFDETGSLRMLRSRRKGIG